MNLFLVYRTWESDDPESTSVGVPYVDSIWSTEAAAKVRARQLEGAFEEIQEFTLDGSQKA